MNGKTIIIVGILALIVGFVIGYAVKPTIPTGVEIFFPKITFKEGIKVERDASIGKEIKVGGNASISGDTSISGKASIGGKASLDGKVAFGGGTDIGKVYHASASVDLPSIATVTTGSATLSVTGATTDMKCFLMPSNAMNDDLIPKGCAVTGADTVTIYVYNADSVATDDTAKTYQVLLLK